MRNHWFEQETHEAPWTFQVVDSRGREITSEMAVAETGRPKLAVESVRRGKSWRPVRLALGNFEVLFESPTRPDRLRLVEADGDATGVLRVHHGDRTESWELHDLKLLDLAEVGDELRASFGFGKVSHSVEVSC